MNCSRFGLLSNVTEPVEAGAGGAVSACIIMSGTGVCGNTGGVDEDASWCRAEDQSSGAVEKDNDNDDGADANDGSTAVDAAVAAVAADDDDAVEVADDVDVEYADVGDDDKGSRTNLDVVVIGDAVLK